MVEECVVHLLVDGRVTWSDIVVVVRVPSNSTMKFHDTIVVLLIGMMMTLVRIIGGCWLLQFTPFRCLLRGYR